MNFRHFIFLVSFHFISFVAMSQTAADFVGIFVSSQTGIQLSINQQNGSFKGEFTAQNQRYGCEATFAKGGLSGVYFDTGRKIGFTLVKSSGEYMLTTEGVNIPMKRTTASSQATAQSSAPTASAPSSSAAKSNGQRLSDAFLGYAFNAPSGWQMQQNNGGYAFGRGDQQVAITVSPHNYNSLADLKKDTQGVQDANSNTYLNARVDPYSDSGAWVFFNGTIQGKPFTIATISLISPHGGGINISCVAPASLYNDALTNTLRSIANTVAFSKPQTSALAEQWKAKLKGKELLYLNTANGMSDKFSIHLCSTGQFTKKEDTSYSSQTFSDNFNYSGRSGDQGRWDVTPQGTTPVLVLRANDGKVFQYQITLRQASNELGLNGRRYFVRASEICR